jgi:peroxiredoxin
MMRNIVIAITAALCLLGAVSPANSLELNEPAPNFTLTDINDKEHKLSDYHGKVILIVWSSIETKDDNHKFKESIYKKYPSKDLSGKGTLVYINVFDPTDKPFYAPMSLVKREMKKEVIKRKKEGTHRHLFLPDYKGEFKKLYNHPKEKHIHLYVIDEKGLIKYHYSSEFSQKEVDKAGEIITQLLKALPED